MRIAPAKIRETTMSGPAPRRAFGIASLDAALGGGLARGRIHEIYAAEVEDVAAPAGFSVAVATGMADPGRTVLWLRTPRAARLGGVMQATGWAELGGAPGHGLVGMVPDAMSLLRAAVDALRCSALGAVIMESWGAMRELDLTASRRLALAAERSGVPLLLLRMDAVPVPSAAQTRWQVAAAPSRALPCNAPGEPAFNLTLLRQRSGPCGLDWRLEWDRDRRMFREAPLSGAVVSVPARRPTAAGRGRPVLEDDRYAA
jgi:protein ImuA